MSNNLHKVEKNLRSIAKKGRLIKYSLGLAILFLMLGVNAFSEEIVIQNEIMSNEEISSSKETLRSSVDSLQSKIKEVKIKNGKGLKDLSLELIQLMEQGDQVVKLPWASWQFGVDYSSHNWEKIYSGKGDKKERYFYEGKFERDKNELNRYVSPISSNYDLLTMSRNFKSASTNARQGLNLNYGIISEKRVDEPIVTLQFTAGITPKTVDRQTLNLQPKMVNTPKIPDVVNFSPVSPDINIPNNPALPSAPQFQLFLGPDSNWPRSPYGNNKNWVTKNTYISETGTINGESNQNIRLLLGYTLRDYYAIDLNYPTSSAWVAYKMWADEWKVFGGYEHKEDGSVTTADENANNWKDPFEKLPNNIYFNSFNFSYINDNEYADSIQSSTVHGNPKNLNNQRFFVGGSRFIELDNAGAATIKTNLGVYTKDVVIPENKTLHLSGPLIMGMVSQENGLKFENKGKITDIEEKNEKFIKETPDELTLDVPLGKLTVKKSKEGYLGYKVGISQVAENSQQSLSASWVIEGTQPMINSGTIDFRGPNSIGMYVYLYTTPLGTRAQLSNKGKILLHGEKSYGMKVSSRADLITNAASMVNDENGIIELKTNGKDRANNSVAMAIMDDNTLKNPASFPKGKALNKGTISLDGIENSLGAYVNIASDITNDNKGKIIINSNIKKVNSGNQTVNIGMRADTKADAEVINKGTITVSGTYGIGMLAKGAKLTNTGTINTGTDIKQGIGIVGIDNAVIKNSGAIKIKGLENAENIGIFLNTNSTGTIGISGGTSQLIDVSGNKSTGVLITGGSSLVMAGNVKVSGNNVSGIVANGTNIRLNGPGTVNVDNNGNVAGAIENKGSYGIVVKGAGTFIGADTTVTAKVTTDKSVGLYSEGILTVNKANIITTDKAINFYAANNGKINITGGLSETGQKSLLFYTSGTGRINFNGSTTATIKGGTNPVTRGTAFYYTAQGLNYGSFTTDKIREYFDNTFGTGVLNSSTLEHLTLNMESGSRLFVASNVLMNLSDTSITNLTSNIAKAPHLSGTNYKTFMLYLSKLVVNQAVNLDDSNDSYNRLEIANSSIENINTIKGTQSKQVAMAQENGNVLNADKVTLKNATGGVINLSGDESTGIYAKRGLIINDGKINVGKKSTAIYLIDNDKGTTATQTGKVINNNGAIIELGEDSTGIYYKNGNSTVADGGIENNGKIKSKADNVVAMTFDSGSNGSKKFENESNGIIELTGDKSIAMYATGTGKYTAKNIGKILLANSSDINDPNVGIFTDKSQITLENNSFIQGGDKTVGIYGYNINLGTDSIIKVGAGGTGIYSKGKNVNINGGVVTVGKNGAVGTYYAGAGGIITNNANIINIGDNSYGFVIKNNNLTTGNILNSNTVSGTIGNGVVYVYSNDKLGQVTNNTNLKSTGNQNYGVYSAGIVRNNAMIDFSKGIGNVGIYSINRGTSVNNGTISVGASDIAPLNPDDRKYSIAMATGYKTTDTGNVVNNNIINVNGNNGIGMYATGEGSIARNNIGAIINLGADGAVGIYLDEKAKGYNEGIIRTTPGKIPEGVVGVIVRKGSTLYNTGTIHIISSGGIAMFQANGGIIHNTGTIILGTSGQAENGEVELGTPGAETSKEVGAIKISAPKGATEAKITVNGLPVTPETIDVTVGNRSIESSSIGMYVDTLSGTNPINGLSSVTNAADLIIGVEATKLTNSKYIKVGDKILKPYNETIAKSGVKNWNIYSGSLTWMATATLGGSLGYINKLYLVKRPYTEFAGNKAMPVDKKDTYNFLNGLEQRYGISGLESKEKELYLKLNGIGKNEEILFYQATDEMMGHQYANVQQRIQATGNILDKEFSHLKDSWYNPTKDSNKVKTFEMKGEYKTDTAGVIDYKYNAYGVAYVHEDEDVKLGKATGWYTGIVHNTFKFEDIGNSKEEQLQAKVGLFKSIPFDDNNSLNWTISGDIFVGHNKMHRKFLVVDEIFNAKSKYYTYGIGIKNEIGKEFRLSEDFSIRPYGALKVEYGRMSKIKEKSGEMKLEVKENDYLSIRPEIGTELAYKHNFGTKTFKTSVGVAYENELGRVANGKNKARVSGTTADWFNIRGEKENRKGNVKFDLNIGLDNQRVGVTVNVGYDTKGNNVRGGVGLRVIF